MEVHEGLALKNYIRMKDLSVFAKSIGCKQSTISYIEKSSKIHMATLKKISEKYKVKMAELLSDTKMTEVDKLKTENAYLLKQNKLLEQMVELLKRER